GVARSGPFAQAQHVLDVAGGSGAFSIALAVHHPALRCTVLDLPMMCELVREQATSAGVGERVGTHEADMFKDAWPTGHDAIFLSNVLHDWSPPTCAWLLRRAFDALPRGGRVHVHEMLLDDDGAGPLVAASFSLTMYLTTQGQQLTFGELSQL